MCRIRLSFWPLLLVLSSLPNCSAQDQPSRVLQGLLLQSHPSQTDASPSESFAERQMSFPSQGTSVSGTLCLPLQVAQKVPIVIFLPEPGPPDLLAGNAFPFVSLAHALAQAGIATLRYDKRELVAPASDHHLTLKDEILDDAGAAILFASKLPEVAPSQIFFLGHALGAALAPYVADASPQVRGLILLAPAVMPIEYTLARYKKDDSSREAKTDAQTQETLKAQNRILADVRSGKVASDRMILGAPASYWRDWMNRDVAGELKKSTLPMLVLQAGRDARSDQAEFDKLETAIGDKPKRMAEVHWFLNLDPRFMPTNGEAHEQQRIDPQVIESISSWVQEHIDTPAQNSK
jgi:uncharacterized protein